MQSVVVVDNNPNNNTDAQYSESSGSDCQQYEGGEASLNSHRKSLGECDMIHYKDDEDEEGYETASPERKRMSDMLHNKQRGLMTESGEPFMVKVINIVGSCSVESFQEHSLQIASSPYFIKECSPPLVDEQQPAEPIEVNFCLFNNGSVSYVTRTLSQVKQVMQRIQRRVINSPTEQSEIAKWHMEIERCEREENFIRIASIIEGFFATVHRKIVQNSI